MRGLEVLWESRTRRGLERSDRMKVAAPLCDACYIPVMRYCALIFLLCTACSAQTARGDRELGFFVAGGPSVAGGRTDMGVVNAGLRYGWVLTNPIGPGFLHGSLEYAVDAIPLYIVTQTSGTTYGASFDPFGLKWNFAGSKRVVPYLELVGGVLFTKDDVPITTSKVNFTPQLGLGFHFTGRRWNPTVAIRYVHISNAGLATPNPGVNTIQFQLALTSFGKR